MALAALMSWWYGAMQRRSRRFAVISGRAYRPRVVRLGRRRLAAWGFVGVYLVLGKVLPITLLAWSSLLPFFQLPSGRAFATISLEHYFSLPWELVLTGLWNTSVLAVLTPSLTLVLSLAFSWIVLRSRYPGRAGFDFVAFLPHAVPSIVFGVGALLMTLFVIQRALPIYGTVWILLIVFTVARLSYGTRMTNSGLIQIHPELEESALMSGATAWGAFARISVPLIAPTLLYAWLWIALLIFRELTLAVILSTADNLTFPVVVWSSLARRRARPGLRARRGNAADDDADDRDLLAVRAPAGFAGELMRRQWERRCRHSQGGMKLPVQMPRLAACASASCS